MIKMDNILVKIIMICLIILFLVSIYIDSEKIIEEFSNSKFKKEKILLAKNNIEESKKVLNALDKQIVRDSLEVQDIKMARIMEEMNMKIYKKEMKVLDEKNLKKEDGKIIFQNFKVVEFPILFLTKSNEKRINLNIKNFRWNKEGVGEIAFEVFEIQE